MIKNIEAVASHLEKAVKAFTDIAVVGISGGVDSSLVASICVAALTAKNVYLLSMPYDEIDLHNFNALSTELAGHLGAHHFIAPIAEGSNAVEELVRKALPDGDLDKLTLANIRPRVRMNILYSVGGELGYKTGKRVRVMGTGHMSEDLIGYDTKGGDALADIFILSELVKSEVYQLATHYKVPRNIIEAAPSAGLYPGQTDEQELGYRYDELEAATLALHNVLKSGTTQAQLDAGLKEFAGLPGEIVAFVLDRYKSHSHKHLAPPGVEIRCTEWFTAFPAHNSE